MTIINEAAHRLRTWIYTGELPKGDFDPLVVLSQALTTERQAGRREAAEWLHTYAINSPDRWRTHSQSVMQRYLDEEAAR